MNISKHKEKRKNCSEQPYTHHLDSNLTFAKFMKHFLWASFIITYITLD